MSAGDVICFIGFVIQCEVTDGFYSMHIFDSLIKG